MARGEEGEGVVRLRPIGETLVRKLCVLYSVFFTKKFCIQFFFYEEVFSLLRAS
jgi:hypothetical protein